MTQPLNPLPQAINTKIGPTTSMRTGVVISVDSAIAITADIGGTAVDQLPYLSSYSPAVGDVVQVIFKDGTWLAIGTVGGGASPNVQVFTVNGTWTKPQGFNYVIIECVGGGGGGGGANAGAAGQHSMGAGGGGGAYARTELLAAAVPATLAISVALGGSGGSTAPGVGNTGGTSSAGTLCSAGGGLGGNTRASEATPFGCVGGAGGTATIGQLQASGGTGQGAWGEAGLCISGAGGSSIYGGGGVGRGSGAAGASNVGAVGNLYGGGGSGAQSQNGGAAALGGAGAAGVVIITCF